jgi:hypothetical protein
MISPFLASIFVILVLNAAYNLHWSFQQTTGAGMTFMDHFRYSTVISTTFLALQVPVYIIAAIAIARIRGRYRIVPALFSGAILFALTHLAPHLRLLPDTMPGWILYIAGFPLLASALQWWPERKKMSIEQSGPAYPPQGVGSADP